MKKTCIKTFKTVRTGFPIAVALLLAVPAADAQWMHRGGVDRKAPSKGYGLDVGFGRTVGDDERWTLTITGRRHLRSVGPSDLDLTLTTVWAPESTDPPWHEHCVAGCVERCPEPEAFAGVGRRDLEVGASLWLIPGLEWTSCRGCFRPSIFVGAGLRHDRGKTTRVGDRIFHVEPDSRPVLSWGVAWQRPVRYGSFLRIEARFLHYLVDGEAHIRGPGGASARPEIGQKTEGILSLGWRLRF